MTRLLTLCLALVLPAACGADGPPAADGERERRPAAAPPDSSLPPGWSRLAPPPVSRSEAAAVWAGGRLVVWGGNSAGDAVHHADGRSYDPSSDVWSPLPEAPLRERSSAGIVWTGSEVVVWGGRGDRERLYADGAAYEPVRGAWRALPAAPLRGREPASTIWTGNEMVVWGDRSRNSLRSDGAAYEPGADHWRRIPEAPFALNEATAVWTGEEVVVVGALLDGFNVSTTERARALAYRPATDTWRVLPDTPLSPQAVSAVWTGSEVVAWDYLLDAAAYSPAKGRWRRLPRLPLEEMEAQPQSAVVGDTVFAWYSGQAAVLDLRAETWTPLRVPRAAREGRLVPADGAAYLLAPATLHGYVP